jgi:hypothetical protein
MITYVSCYDSLGGAWLDALPDSVSPFLLIESIAAPGIDQACIELKLFSHCGFSRKVSPLEVVC